MAFDADRETAVFFRTAKIAGLATFAGCFMWLPVVRYSVVNSGIFC